MAEDDDKNLPVYKVSLCGKSGVGKTSIFRQILGDGFKDDTSKFKHLAEEKVNVSIKGKTIKIHLVDTAGMERYGRLTRQHYYGSHVVLLVYDCDDNESLQALKDFYKDAKVHTGGAAMVLVRNKIDKDFQSVDIRETANLVCNHDRTRGTSVCRFMFKAETSAKENLGIKELLQKIAQYLIQNAEPSNKRNEFDKIRIQEEQRQQTAPTPLAPPPPTTKSNRCCS